MSMRFTLNSKEEVVLRSMPAPTLDGDGRGEFKTLEEIAKKAFGDQKRGSAPRSKGNSWVRNSMRKLLRLGLVLHGPGKSGQYARTRVTLKEIAAKEEARKEASKKQGAAAKPRTKVGKAAKVVKKKTTGDRRQATAKKKAEKESEGVLEAESSERQAEAAELVGV
jgi:hypothetical protein